MISSSSDFLRHSLATLQSQSVSGPVASNTPFSLGCFFSWDHEAPGISVKIETGQGALLRADLRVPHVPRWLTLNFVLGDGPFGSGDIVILAVHAAATLPFTCKGFIRTGWTEDRFVDTPLDDVLTVGPEPRRICLMHKVKPHETLVGAGRWRTLVLPLPKADFSLAVQGMAFAVLPRSAGLGLGPATVSDFAAPLL